MQLSHGLLSRRSLGWFNGLPVDEAESEVRSCCAAGAWVDAVVRARPYASVDSLLDTSDASVAALDADGFDQALAAHARIGERRTGESREDSWSRAEQVGALTAGSDIATRLADGNRAYEERFGRVFLIRAAGRSAEEMYDALRGRLRNDDETETVVAKAELAQIVRLRLGGLVGA